jgi:putative transposase
MANTFTQLIIHGVFAVKHRNAIIEKEWQHELFGYIGASLNKMGHTNLIVNGVADHVHILFGMKPTLALSDTMRDVKANASKWLNESEKLKHKFTWQDGYGGFSISRTHLDAVFNYIKTQEDHHRKVTFRSEYLDLLSKNELVFDEKWIFEDLK